ncbi:hypothetical protein ACHAXS_000585 [Conticribra weissflogii]
MRMFRLGSRMITDAHLFTMLVGEELLIMK